MIHTEEEYEASQRKLNPGKAVHVTVTLPEESEIRDLRVDVQELKSQLIALSIAQSHPPPTPEPVVITGAEASGEDKNIEALKKKVKKWRKQISVMAVNPTTVFRDTQLHPDAPPFAGWQKASSQRDSSDFFCYCCGEAGHFATKCSAAENYLRVIQKLIRAQRQLKTNQREQSAGTTAMNPVNAGVKRSAVDVQAGTLPEWLVGPPSTAEVKVDGKPCTALLDSGSQVMIIFDSWYVEHLSRVPIHRVTDLHLWGLSESDSYPYRGYIQVDLELPEEEPGKVKSIPVLALVCPDLRCSHIPVLVGTNVRKVRPHTANAGAEEPSNIRWLKVGITEKPVQDSHAIKPPRDNPEGSPVAEVK